MMSQDVLYKKPVMYVHQTPITAGPIGEVSLNHIQLFNKLGVSFFQFYTFQLMMRFHEKN